MDAAVANVSMRDLLTAVISLASRSDFKVAAAAMRFSNSYLQAMDASDFREAIEDGCDHADDNNRRVDARAVIVALEEGARTLREGGNRAARRGLRR